MVLSRHVTGDGDVNLVFARDMYEAMVPTNPKNSSGGVSLYREVFIMSTEYVPRRIGFRRKSVIANFPFRGCFGSTFAIEIDPWKGNRKSTADFCELTFTRNR